MPDKIKRRGRPPLSDEEREIRRIEHNRAASERHKKTNYAAQKKYREAHPEIYQGRFYEPKLRIPICNKDAFLKLADDNNISVTQLCLLSIKEKFGIDFNEPIDSQ